MIDDQAPLAGLRVVELSSFVAAPLGGMTLAQLGADVVRVDPIGGGPDLGRWPLAPSGRSLYWTGLNKGKRSLTVDLRSARGRELVAGLAAAAGTLVTNAPPRPGLAYEELLERRPDLVYARLLGHRDGRNAVDYTVNAELGFPYVTGPERHGAPVNHVLPAWDVACGLYLAVGLLAADRQRTATGRGRRIELALHDVALATAGNLGYLAQAQFGESRPRIGNDLYGDLGRDFGTADGRRVMVVVLTERHWHDLVTATGLARVVAALEQALPADFRRDRDRYAHREALAGLLAPWFAARTAAEVDKALAGTSVLWARYRTFAEAATDLGRHPLMAELRQPGVGPHLAPGSPLVLDGRQAPPEPAPDLGGDAETVLGDLLGLPPAQVAALRADGVIG
ncbi:CoA transferase [Actinomadura sp. ATCC 31491]|uniref:CoA transferase n=1 Tax=Actinomadura luzonensis TaxID=2805427 RepID=A0ABT0G6M9_9ACTN|nr:CoA transferase [Actinomadura luzonensis]MCK2220272.1 CoA transferase [Actinomadura luzonensis]